MVQQHGQLRHVYSKVPIDVHNFHPDEISKPGANRNHHETFSSVSCSQYPRCSGFLLPKVTQEGPLLCGVALKNRCGKSKPATTIAALTAWKYNSRNPKEQTLGCPTDSTLLTFLGNG